jgi:hypothetical protein
MRKPIGSRFQEMNRLYHFTSFDAACKIIGSKRLRFGKSYKMNDLLESNKIVFERVLSSEDLLSEVSADYAEREMRRYQQISFTQDREYDGAFFLGFDLHLMWGLYADRGYGICLVFDKEKLRLEEGDYAKEVEYFDMTPTNYGFRNRSKTGIRSEIRRRVNEIFFLKRKEWEYEQEYRIIRRASRADEDNYLDIGDALSFVILCKDRFLGEYESIWEGDYYYEIRSIDRKLPILSYENDLDGFTLSPPQDDPIWTEQTGFI